MVIIEKAARQSISLLLPLEAGKTKATTKKNKKTNAKKQYKNYDKYNAEKKTIKQDILHAWASEVVRDLQQDDMMVMLLVIPIVAKGVKISTDQFFPQKI